MNQTFIELKQKRRARRRCGAAFLLLVVIVLLVVVAAVRTLVISEASLRRHDLDHHRAQTLVAAIETVVPTIDESFASCRLPIASATAANEYIEVAIDREESSVTATWYREDKTIDTLTRQFNPNTENNE